MGALELIVQVLQVNLLSLTSCCLSVRKLVIHSQIDMGTESWCSLVWSIAGMMVLNAAVKSTKRILAYVPGLSRCCKI